jgi:hypothetical protein
MTRLVCALTATAAVLLAGLTWKAEATTLMVAIRPLAGQELLPISEGWVPVGQTVLWRRLPFCLRLATES